MPPSIKDNEFEGRIHRFQQQLMAREVEAALMVEKVDVYYLSGTDQDAHLWVPADGAPLLMVRKSIERARQDSALRQIAPLNNLKDLPELVSQHSGTVPRRIGLEMDILPAKLYLAYHRLFPDAELMDISPLIRAVRMIKSNYEISCIKRAAKMADDLFEAIPGFLKETETENDLAVKAEAFYRTKGHPGFVRTRTFNMECYYGQIMSGKSSAMPSASPGPTGGIGFGPFYSQGGGLEKIRENDPIIVDYAANVEGYIADQARIFSLGPLADKLYRAHNVMLEIQETIAEKALPGVMAEDLYDLAMEMAETAGLLEGFMGYPQPVPFVGHGVGLEIDERPVIGRASRTLLEEGMVMTLEPKVVLPGTGTVGIENTFVVTPKGMKKLNRFPDAIFTC